MGSEREKLQCKEGKNGIGGRNEKRGVKVTGNGKTIKRINIFY
jgi:hypothetical protein